MPNTETPPSTPPLRRQPSRTLSDFPLSPLSLQITNLSTRLRSIAMSLDSMDGPEETTPPGHISVRDAIAAAREDKENEPPADLKPIVTVVNILRDTPYKDGEDKTERSLWYIQAQRAVLRFLDRSATDELTAEYARELTDEIAAYPTTTEALRFCYYMRSLGFATYAKLDHKKNAMKLYIANPKSNVQSADKLYWEQNLKTGHIKPLPPSSRERRNAVDYSDGVIDLDPGLGGFTSLRGGSGSRRVLRPVHATTEVAEQNTELAIARSSLELLLAGGGADPDRIATSIARIESLQEQENGGS